MAERHVAGPPGEQLLGALLGLARTLSGTALEGVAAAIERHEVGAWTQLKDAATRSLAPGTARTSVAQMIDIWRTTAGAIAPVAVAWALRAAVRSEQEQRARQSIELVWTGPNPSATPLRRTDQALLEVIDGARRILTIVTFAAYRIPAIREALVEAARRGVTIRIVVESAQASEGKVTFDAVKALGSDVARHAQVFIWPLERRPTDAAGRHGSLHVKCAVADGVALLVSSANLTEYALLLNMELGLLVRGGDLPARVEAHLDRLVEQQTLTRVDR